jgi:hypothetical protein
MSIFLKLLGLDDDLRRAKTIMVAIVAGVFLLGALMGIAVAYHPIWVRGQTDGYDKGLNAALVLQARTIENPADTMSVEYILRRDSKERD